MAEQPAGQSAAEEEPTSWAESRLPLERAAGLIALADGLCRIGRAREGKRAGQFSIFNFLLRAAWEGQPPDEALVVLMRAGVFRRHAWYARVHLGPTPRLELASPIDRGWEWWPEVVEISKRLAGESIWRETVGMSWEARSAAIAARLASARLVKIRR